MSTKRYSPTKNPLPGKRQEAPNLWKDSRGVVTVLAAVFLIALIGLAALVIDLGQLLIVKGELQNAADSAALAGVVDLIYSGPSEAEATAVTYATKQEHYRIARPSPNADAVAVTPLGADKLQVKVKKAKGTSAGAVPTTFARIWGIQGADVEALAVATVNRKVIGSGPGNLLPYGIHKSKLDTDGDGLYDVGNALTIYPYNWEPGNFGILDLDYGGNSNSDVERWTRYGFDQSFVIPQDTGSIHIPGDTGISGYSLTDALMSRIGDRLLLPVFDEVVGVGSNADFRVMDLVGVIITEVHLTGNPNERHISIIIENFSSTSLIVGGAEETPSSSTLSRPILIQ